MSSRTLEREAAVVRRDARPIVSAVDYDDLIHKAGEASIVLIGEASHGTHEFYGVRAELTGRLIQEKGFRGIALEADWPDSHRIHRYINGVGEDATAEQALDGFRRFPGWMWRNTVMAGFIPWLKQWNERVGGTRNSVGIYGMDLYSMHTSIESVLGYLSKVDPQAERRARHRYACFEDFSLEPQTYGYATVRRGKEPCEDEVVEQLMELRRREPMFTKIDGQAAREDYFSAEQNARLIMNAERYYRSMFHGRDASWNLRDTHMYETLLEIRSHLDDGASKIVVWAHNSHLGDARATGMSSRGELNLGQLLREKFGKQVYSIGLSTSQGTVTAASNWGEPAMRKRLRAGLSGSCEDLFHTVGVPAFWLDLQKKNDTTALLRDERLQRAIGVIYRPETERWSHYDNTRLTEQFDALIHLDETQALEPLDREEQWDRGELAETYPSGL